jgi:hypothetical protein
VGSWFPPLDAPDPDKARHWYEQAAIAGHISALHNLGYLLAEWLDPPDLYQARHWYEQAAGAGHTGAMNNLGYLLVYRLDPPELDQARRGYEQRRRRHRRGGRLFSFMTSSQSPVVEVCHRGPSTGTARSGALRPAAVFGAIGGMEAYGSRVNPAPM